MKANSIYQAQVPTFGGTLVQFQSPVLVRHIFASVEDIAAAPAFSASIVFNSTSNQFLAPPPTGFMPVLYMSRFSGAQSWWNFRDIDINCESIFFEPDIFGVNLYNVIVIFRPYESFP